MVCCETGFAITVNVINYLFLSFFDEFFLKETKKLAKVITFVIILEILDPGMIITSDLHFIYIFDNFKEISSSSANNF